MPEIEKLAEGDVVALKSGGPKMTVHDHPDCKSNVHCFWFTPDGELRTGNFRPGMLVAAAFFERPLAPVKVTEKR